MELGRERENISEILKISTTSPSSPLRGPIHPYLVGVPEKENQFDYCIHGLKIKGLSSLWPLGETLQGENLKGEMFLLKFINLSPKKFPDLENRCSQLEKKLATIELPSLLKPIGVGWYEERVYFVYPQFSFLSLREVHNSDPPGEEVPQLVKRLISYLKILEPLHKLGFYHGSLSPDNLQLNEDHHYWVNDFGPGSLFNEIFSKSQIQTRIKSGGFDYLAPEIKGSQKTPDFRVDFYSLGVVIYELLTHRLPLGFNRPLGEQKFKIPKELEELVKQCLSIQPEERPCDCKDFIQKLLKIPLGGAATNNLIEVVGKPSESASFQGTLCPLCASIGFGAKECWDCGQTMEDSAIKRSLLNLAHTSINQGDWREGDRIFKLFLTMASPSQKLWGREIQSLLNQRAPQLNSKNHEGEIHKVEKLETPPCQENPLEKKETPSIFPKKGRWIQGTIRYPSLFAASWVMALFLSLLTLPLGFGIIHKPLPAPLKSIFPGESIENTLLEWGELLGYIPEISALCFSETYDRVRGQILKKPKIEKKVPFKIDPDRMKSLMITLNTMNKNPLEKGGMDDLSYGDREFLKNQIEEKNRKNSSGGAGEISIKVKSLDDLMLLGPNELKTFFLSNIHKGDGFENLRIHLSQLGFGFFLFCLLLWCFQGIFLFILANKSQMAGSYLAFIPLLSLLIEVGLSESYVYLLGILTSFSLFSLGIFFLGSGYFEGLTLVSLMILALSKGYIWGKIFNYRGLTPLPGIFYPLFPLNFLLIVPLAFFDTLEGDLAA